MSDGSKAGSDRSRRLSARDRQRHSSGQAELPFSEIQQKVLETLRTDPELQTVSTPASDFSPGTSNPESAPPVSNFKSPIQDLETPPLPVRRLHNYAYCPRLFYYQWVENIFVENADTVAGSSVHRQAEKPSRLDDPKALDLPEGAKLRSLQLESSILGMIGVVDVVEGGENGLEIIDYKKGSARRDENDVRCAKEADAIQVAAYALLLEENGQKIVQGWIYYAAEKRRVPVDLTPDLLQRCRNLIVEAKTVALEGICPPPLQDDPRCLYCSAYPVCLPNESSYWNKPDQKPPKITQAPRPDNDTGEVLVVQKPGTSIGLRGGEIIVSDKKETLAKLPMRQVRAVYVYGAVQVTAQAAQTFLEEGIDVSYFSPAGRFLGLLRGLPESGVDARLGQYRLFGESALRLRLSREIVRAKIHNQRVLLMRNGEVPDKILQQMSDLRDQTAEASSMTSLLGTEGAAAALYFEYFSTMLKGKAVFGFDFQGRNRRPPRDPVNAILSLGYSMLSKELTGVCHTVGLDPFLGFFHQPRFGRPALALDLMEEFRPLIADSIVISVLNRNEISPGDFIQSSQGTFLNDAGRRAYWEAYFRRMDTEVTHPQFGYAMAYRRMLEVQARQLWRFVRGEAENYQGFTTR